MRKKNSFLEFNICYNILINIENWIDYTENLADPMCYYDI